MHGSDEEAILSPEVDSDEDFSDGEKILQEEVMIYEDYLVDSYLVGVILNFESM